MFTVRTTDAAGPPTHIVSALPNEVRGASDEGGLFFFWGGGHKTWAR